MAADSQQIRPPPSAGSGTGEPNPAATSCVGSEAVSNRSGAVPDRTDMIVLPLADGGELRICAVHGRVEILARLGKGRVFATTPVMPERAEYYGARITEIAQHARAQRDSKGA